MNELLLNIQLQIDALFQNIGPNDWLLIHYCSCVAGFSENKQYFMRELLHIINMYKTTTLCIFMIHWHYSLWLDTGMVSDQLIFHRNVI